MKRISPAGEFKTISNEKGSLIFSEPPSLITLLNLFKTFCNTFAVFLEQSAITRIICPEIIFSISIVYEQSEIARIALMEIIFISFSLVGIPLIFVHLDSVSKTKLHNLDCFTAFRRDSISSKEIVICFIR